MIGSLAVFVVTLLRFLVLGALIGALAIVLTHWAVRAGHLPPFSPWSRFVRRWSDPLLRPIEGRLVRAGRNPQEAGLWLLAGVVLVGILVLSLARWTIGFVYRVASLRHAGPLALLGFFIDVAFNVLIIALLVRVVGSWLGAGRYNRATKWSYSLTDWLVEPIRRRLPPFGPLDLSPLIAYVALLLLRGALFMFL